MALDTEQEAMIRAFSDVELLLQANKDHTEASCGNTQSKSAPGGGTIEFTARP